MPDSTALRGRDVDVTRPFALGPKEILLTFDDGPHPTVTRAVQATLEGHDLRGIFFLIGDMVQQAPELVGATMAAGHLVGSHTVTHPHCPELPLAEAQDEIRGGQAWVTAALGRPAPPLFRYPYLEHTLELDLFVAAQGLRIFDAEMLFGDWEDVTPDTLTTRVIARLDAGASGTICLHDVHERTASALPAILGALAERGYSVVTPVLG